MQNKKSLDVRSRLLKFKKQIKIKPIYSFFSVSLIYIMLILEKLLKGR